MNGSGFYAKTTLDLEKAKAAENIGRKVLGLRDRPRFLSAMARKIAQDRTNVRINNKFVSSGQWLVVSKMRGTAAEAQPSR